VSFNWKLIEKSLSILSIVFGIFVILLVFYTWEVILSRYFDTGLITWDNLSFFKVFKNTHFFMFLGILGLISGILLLKNKRSGWISNLASWISYAVGIIIVYWKGNQSGKLLVESQTHFAIILSIVFVFLIFASLLLSKSIRLKYKPTSNSWIAVGLIILTFVMDKILLD
jgi:hypothetical protein